MVLVNSNSSHIIAYFFTNFANLFKVCCNIKAAEIAQCRSDFLHCHLMLDQVPTTKFCCSYPLITLVTNILDIWVPLEPANTPTHMYAHMHTNMPTCMHTCIHAHTTMCIDMNI